MVDLEDMVSAFECHEGHELVDFRLLGIPVYRLVLDTIVLAKTPISALESYVLRCLSIGVETCRDISRTLGLDASVVGKVCDVLEGNDLIAEAEESEVDNKTYVITRVGDDVLEQDGAIAPEERTEFIEYDGWCRKPVRLPLGDLYTAKQILAQGGLIMPAFPGQPPRLEELSRTNIESILVGRGALCDGERLLELKRIAKRILRYRAAVGVLYRSLAADELRLTVLLGTAPSDTHEWAFAGGGGLKRTDLIRGVASGPIKRRLQQCMGEAACTACAPSENFCADRKQRMDILRRLRVLRKSLAEATDKAKRAELEHDINLNVAEAETMESQIERQTVRPVSPLEYEILVEEALSTAARAVMIDSTGIDALMLRKPLLELIEKKLDAGVRIAIRCNQKYVENAENQPPTVERLMTLRNNRLLTVENRPKGAVFYLLKDDDFALITNRPLLKSAADDRRFKCQQGYLIRDQYLAEHARKNTGRVGGD